MGQQIKPNHDEYYSDITYWYFMYQKKALILFVWALTGGNDYEKIKALLLVLTPNKYQVDSVNTKI